MSTGYAGTRGHLLLRAGAALQRGPQIWLPRERDQETSQQVTTGTSHRASPGQGQRGSSPAWLEDGVGMGFCRLDPQPPLTPKPRDIWPRLGTLLVVTTGERGATGIEWVEAMGAAEGPTVHRPPLPPTQPHKRLPSPECQ